MIEKPEDDWYDIQNIVCTAELNRSLNLSALAVGLGLEVTEYEPEQFPGLIYRPENTSCVVLLFATGRVVITGSANFEEIKNTHADVSDQISELLMRD